MKIVRERERENNRKGEREMGKWGREGREREREREREKGIRICTEHVRTYTCTFAAPSRGSTNG